MSPLLRTIEALIAAEGPIGLDRYMSLALAHPTQGYYVTRDPLGAAGDFTTAPEISQMFGELLGLWAASVWIEMGRPSPVILAELGPGRGTLMADALRAGRTIPGFRDALSLHLVETSPALRARQRATLDGWSITWHDDISSLPAGPLLVLANEFLDALPIRQFVRGREAWHERQVGLGEDGRLCFALAPFPASDISSAAGRMGDVIETSPASDAVVAGLAKRLAATGGAALFIDYGSESGESGDTLQAVRDHAFASPLAAPGEADITAHVRFGRLARIAREAGASTYGPIGQGDFLLSLGLRERSMTLMRGRDEAARRAIEAQFARLAGPGPAGMGTLFKAFGISGSHLAALPGLPRRDAGAPSE